LHIGANNGNGYVQFQFNGKNGYAHRYAWERINGPIPAGLTIDHLCRVRRCVNVAHIELVDTLTNYQRAVDAWTLCNNGLHVRHKRGICAACALITRKRNEAKRLKKKRVDRAALRELVHARESGLCVRCSTFVSIDDGELHHRQLRSRGGRDDAWNCIWLCRGCHGGVHRNPAWSTRLGLLCPSWETPSGWPVDRGGQWFIPSPAGWLKAAMRVEQEAS